ncbi:MAG: M1 family metallopeptidase [Candidatus Delongbacteria bacterium]|nr:M1 family metallopeptidase [Candidatus Delongbacteria bacterium]
MPKIFILLLVIGLSWSSLMTAQPPVHSSPPNWRDQKSRALGNAVLNLARMTSLPAAIDQSNYDVKFYDLHFSFDLNKKILYGTTGIDLVTTRDSVETIYLDLMNNMAIDDMKGNVLSWAHPNNTILIELDRSYQKGEPVHLEISYHGNPQTGGFGAFGFTYNTSGGYLIWSLSEHLYSRVWWPCKDHQTDKADSVDITITVPKGLLAASNGLLVNTTVDNGMVTFYWQERYPIAPYLVSLAISNYKYQMKMWEYNGISMPSVCYYYPGIDSQTIAWVIDTHNSGMTVFSDLFGTYPFIKEKYGSAQFNWGGGMEHQTLTSLGGYGTDLIIHELSHQWWGDYITCGSWHDIWLNEGFASICEALYHEQIEGINAYHTYVRNNFTTGLDNIVYIQDTTNVSSVFSRTVYDKGAWVVHMLRYITGDSTFFRILKTYYQELPYTIAMTDDFKAICENVSGQELSWFFDQWIYSAGRPAYRVYWGIETQDDGHHLKITINQTQSGNAFKMPIQFKVKYNATSDTMIQVWNDSKIQQYDLVFSQKPSTISMDPTNWILKKSISYTVGASESDQLESRPVMAELATYPNPCHDALQIRFSLSRNEPIQISFYNLLGIKVDEIPHRILSPGPHVLEWNPAGLPGGTYLYEIRMKDEAKKGKIALIR